MSSCEVQHSSLPGSNDLFSLKYNNSLNDVSGLKRVTYSVPLVFIGGLGAHRYAIFPFEPIASEVGVKIISIDRPGSGGTSKLDEDAITAQSYIDINTGEFALSSSTIHFVLQRSDLCN